MMGRNTYTHDGRHIRQSDPLGRLTTFAQDVDNRIAVDATGRSTFTYDLLNRRTGAIDPAGHAITYSYDAVGQRAGMLVPDAGRFTYAWDARGQIAHLINAQADRTTFSYDAAGRRTLTELANGTRASYTYDAASRVQQLYNLKADGSVILGLTYERDPVGNPTSMLESSGDRVTWTYDAADRLTREQRSGPSAYDTTYTYDPLGNRLGKDASGALTTSTYDLGNQLVTSQNAAGTTTYTYDLAGNLHIVEQPTGQRTTTTWDDQNRQISVLLPDGSAVISTFRYDGLRYSKQEPQATTNFLWDFNNYLAETDAADEIQAVYTNEPQPYGNLISQYRKGPTLWLPSYYHYDALGSARALTDASAQITDTYLYDAWGNAIASSGSTDNPFRWVGQVGYYWDKGLGTFYIRARVYEPVIGRWMSQDFLFYPVATLLAGIASQLLVIGDSFDGAHGTRIYGYANNGPTRDMDPLGLQGLRDKDAGSVMDCLLGKVTAYSMPVIGQANDKQCQLHILNRLKGTKILAGLKDIGQTLMLLPGAVLPTSLKGKLTASVIAAIADAAASGGVTEEELVDHILDVIKKTAPGTPVDDAIGEFARNLASNLIANAIGRCRAAEMGYSTSAKGFREQIACEFLVCANVRRGVFANAVQDWWVTGGCNYSCTPSEKRCCACGASLHFHLVQASGTGGGAKCPYEGEFHGTITR